MTQHRSQILTELRDFIKISEQCIKSILEELNWTPEKTSEQPQKEHNLRKHNGKKGGNISKEDPEYPPSFSLGNSVNLCSAVLDEILTNSSTKGKNIPNKFSDTQIHFTREEKLQIYEHIIKNTRKCVEPEITISISENDEEISKSGGKKHMTFAEIVSLKRDMKRRRMKYRVTKIPPLSYTEEIRNLIELQMQALSQYSWNHSAEFQKQPIQPFNIDCWSESKRPEIIHPEASTSSKETKRYPSSSNKKKDIEEKTSKVVSTLHKKERKHRNRSKERKKKRKRRHSHSGSSSEEKPNIRFSSSELKRKKHHSSSPKHENRKKR